MKKIGKQVAFLPTSQNNPRNGEGSFLRLADGRIMYAYTEYYGDSWIDHATARISAIYSSDEGESWTAPSVLLEKGEHQQNVMSPSLIRLPNGKLGMVYLEKLEASPATSHCMPVFRYSDDEGKTFSGEIPMICERGYYVVNNDRIFVTKNGRILVPVAHHGDVYDHIQGLLLPARIRLFYSDDSGLTWGVLPGELYLAYSDAVGLQEPGVLELSDGTLWLYCRTAYGYQYHAFSHDGGHTFSTPEPNLFFTSPDSPMLMKQLSRGTVAVFNPNGFNCTVTHREIWGAPRRTPYILAVTDGDGSAFDNTKTKSIYGGFNPFVDTCYFLEDDTGESYCYPAVLEVEGGFLVAYYHSNGTGICLNSTKITKVLYDEVSL